MTGMLEKPKPLANRQSGFTLLEVMIAVAILAISLGSIIAIEGSSIDATIRAKRMNVVAMLAKNQMIESEYKIRRKNFEEVAKETEGKFQAPYDEYRWKMTIKELKFPKISLPTPKDSSAGGTGASQNAGGESAMSEMITKLTTTFLSKALREMSVSVIWMQGKKEQSFTLSTYWVDLNHEFTLSE